MRNARFRVQTHLDGKPEVTLEVSYDSAKSDGVVSVRPLHSRMEYTALLSDVAQFVAARHAKMLVSQNGINVPKARRKV